MISPRIVSAGKENAHNLSFFSRTPFSRFPRVIERMLVFTRTHLNYFITGKIYQMRMSERENFMRDHIEKDLCGPSLVSVFVWEVKTLNQPHG